MKTIFLLFATTCLIGGLAANTLNFPLEDENVNAESFVDNNINDQLEIFYPENGREENLIIPFPKPTRPPVVSTTTTSAPSTSTTTTTPSTPRPRPPRPTSTPRPRPPRPTTTPRPRPPRPFPPRPRPGNPQIYENKIRGLGPFASQLVNIVLNKGGSQKTAQENGILYNFKTLTENRELTEEEIEN